MTAERTDKRIPELDFVRLIAIAAVILLHTVSGVSDTIPGEMSALQLGVYKCIEALCAFGVPCFLMISGALLLDPAKKIPLKTLLTRYILRIALVILLFGTLFSYAELLERSAEVPLSLLPQAFQNMLRGDSWAHMWYLYMLLGIYLVLPLLKGYAAIADRKTQLFVSAVLFVFLSLLPFPGEHFSFRVGLELPVQGIYVFYFLTGYLLHSRKKSTPIWLPILTLLLSLALILYNFMGGKGWNMNYDSPVIVVFSLSVFLLLSSRKGTHKIAVRLAPYVFGMYLTHAVFLNVLYKIWHITPLMAGGFILLPLFFAGAFLFSLLASFLLRLIPPLRQYIL